ncbi:MAG: YggS family pyridoxal phosphate-dependent enzyme [Gammaproteobacteria bacterium]
MPKNNAISDNLIFIKNKISEFEKKYHRGPGCVQLLAASKTQSIEKITAAYQAGQHLFGENHLQEALDKINQLSKLNIEWHFIGSIQRNKTKKIAEHFSWVQSVDNQLIIDRLNEQRPTHFPPLNICLEVNLSGEASKSGVHLNDVIQLATYCKHLPNIRLRGLMSIPAPSLDFATQRAQFKLLFECYQMLQQQGFQLDTLSMGMSDDFEAAIAEGSTMVRIGTRIFG